jgi:hypothetical protein
MKPDKELQKLIIESEKERGQENENLEDMIRNSIRNGLIRRGYEEDSYEAIINYFMKIIKYNLHDVVLNNVVFKSQDKKIKYSTRKPNEKEKRDFMKERLRYIYFNQEGRTPIKKSQYVTMKGHIRKYQYDIVFSFLKNHGIDVEKIKEDFSKYSESEIIMEVIQDVKVQEQPKMYSILIDANEVKN